MDVTVYLYQRNPAEYYWEFLQAASNVLSLSRKPYTP